MVLTLPPVVMPGTAVTWSVVSCGGHCLGLNKEDARSPLLLNQLDRIGGPDTDHTDMTNFVSGEKQLRFTSWLKYSWRISKMCLSVLKTWTIKGKRWEILFKLSSTLSLTDNYPIFSTGVTVKDVCASKLFIRNTPLKITAWATISPYK